MTMAQPNLVLSKKSLEEDEGLLTCGICKEIFTDPKQLPCVHCFCKHCLQLMTNNTDCSSLRCPVCRREFDIPENKVASFEDNEYLKNLSEIFKAKKAEDANQPLECSICKEFKQPDGISHCLECDDNLCNKCEEYHKKFEKLSRGHTVVPYKELICTDGILNRSKASCKVHTSKMLELFCFTCHESMCLECLNSHIKDSKDKCDIKPLPIPRETLMETWNDHIHCLEEIIQVYEKEVADCIRVQQNLYESKEKVRKEILAESDRVISAVKENTNILLERLDEEFKADEKVATLHRDKAESIIESCKHLLKIREHIMKNGKDIELIPAMTTLEERLKDFKQSVDYLSIEGMFRFVPTNSSEFGTLQKMRICLLESWKDLSILKPGDKVRRGKAWKARENDYRYHTGTILSTWFEQSSGNGDMQLATPCFKKSGLLVKKKIPTLTGRSVGPAAPASSGFGSSQRINLRVSWDNTQTETTSLIIKGSTFACFEIAPVLKCWCDIPIPSDAEV